MFCYIMQKRLTLTARRLEAARKEQGDSNNAFAKRIGVTRQLYGQWVSAGRTPTAEKARGVAAALGCTLEWVLGVPDAQQFAEQDRPAATLADDVARYVEREVLAVAKRRGLPEELFEGMTVDGVAALEAFASREIERLVEAWRQAGVSAATGIGAHGRAGLSEKSIAEWHTRHALNAFWAFFDSSTLRPGMQWRTLTRPR
jgi:transcriptional regulator with XRE-family HTH domain